MREIDNKDRKAIDNPAADAAGLLLRIGFAILVLVAPVAAVFSRRAFVVLVPVGCLLIAASAIVLDAGGIVRRMRDSLGSSVGIAILVLSGWMALSLLWTPFPGLAFERAFRITGNVVMAMAVASALPERMRASNLHLMTIGVALATLALSLSAFAGPLVRLTLNPEAPTFARAAIATSVMVWPAVAWTFIRGRDWQGMALIAVSGVAAAASGSLEAALTLISALLVFLLARVNAPVAARLLSYVAGISILLAPAFAFLARSLATSWGLAPTHVLSTLGLWASQIGSEPFRLITGHGFDTSHRAQMAGVLNPAAPDGLIPMLWYDLGLPGVVLFTIAVCAGFRAIGRLNQPLAPASLAALVACLVFGMLDPITTQAWWLSVCAVVYVMLIAVRNAQYRTTRPMAAFKAAQGEG